MKKFYAFFLAMTVALQLSAQSDVIALDLTTATDIYSNPINYETKSVSVFKGDLQNVWDSTYSIYSQVFYSNGGTFSFAHIPMGENLGGTYWDGFTLSKATSADNKQFGCAAKGGIAGEGTPFLVGYFAAFDYMSGNAASTTVYFDGEYYPTQVSVCQSLYTLESITNGDGFARAFTDTDTLTLIVHGLNNLYEEVGSVKYHLAVGRKFNTAWEAIDLSSLGKVWGLAVTMTSTDGSAYGPNTPTYFALDGLKVSTTEPTSAIKTVDGDAFALVAHRDYVELRNASAPIEVYNLQGIRMLTTNEASFATTGWPCGVYIVRGNGTTAKFVKR